MDSLQSLDVALFRFVNVDIKNAFLDWILPYFSSNAFFVPVLALLAVYMIWWGGVRGRLLVFFLLLTFLIGDPVIVSSLKKWIDRPRPYTTLHGIHLIVGRTGNPSMPSGHAANWFAAMLVCLVYYRRTLWFMLPMALIEAFSRVYLGVHYPSDVTVGAVLGCVYSGFILWASHALWRTVGPRWFPIWWAALPSILNPEPAPELPTRSVPTVPESAAEARRAELDRHWVRLAYVLIAALFVGHIIYIALGKIELSEDEAYQWLWSKHLALSYYSKPPLIAYTQFLATHLWGDTAFGVRFFSPVLASIGAWLLVRFLAREANGFAACMSVLVASAMPMLMAGATLMTIDSLSVLFWLAAMLSGWSAVQRDSTAAWLWTGLWMGLGFLSKYIALFQWICWAVFFVVWPAARAQLRRPGPYLALGINLLCLVPVALWNIENHWITVTHLANRGGLDRGWQPTLRFLWDFLLAETFLLNPVFWLATVWAAFRFWKRPLRNQLTVYLFSMGWPLFLFYLIYTFRSRVQPNWVAPSLLPLLALAIVYWDSRGRQGAHWVKHWLMAGLASGWLVVVFLHDTRLIGKVTGFPISVALDPLTRVRGWEEMADVVASARRDLEVEGKPVFVIASHYGTTSLLKFYMAETKPRGEGASFVYCLPSDDAKNQFYFWPGYAARCGENAIYIAPIDRGPIHPPARLLAEFESVTDLGMRDILYKDSVFHQIQLFACRQLR